jgi:hypothetical protein
MVFVLFVIAQVVHILVSAYFTANNVNTRWQTVQHYIRTNAYKLVSQLVLSFCAFWVLVDNPELMERVGAAARIGPGLAILLGWSADSILDKVLGFWGLKREV